MRNINNKSAAESYKHIERDFWEMIESGTKRKHPTEEHLRKLWELMKGHIHLFQAWNIYAVDIINLISDLVIYGEPKGWISESTFSRIYRESSISEDQLNHAMESLKTMI